VQRDVLRDEIALTDEVVLLDGDRPEVVVDGAQDALQALAALGTGGMVHHVRGDELVERAVVTSLLSSEHLIDDFLRIALAHDPILRGTELADQDPARALLPARDGRSERRRMAARRRRTLRTCPPVPTTRRR
jgi:hypothetical protein